MRSCFRMKAYQLADHESLWRQGFNGRENHVESEIVADSLPKGCLSLELIPRSLGDNQKKGRQKKWQYTKQKDSGSAQPSLRRFVKKSFLANSLGVHEVPVAGGERKCSYCEISLWTLSKEGLRRRCSWGSIANLEFSCKNGSPADQRFRTSGHPGITSE